MKNTGVFCEGKGVCARGKLLCEAVTKTNQPVRWPSRANPLGREPCHAPARPRNASRFLARCRLQVHVEKRPERLRDLRQHLRLHLRRDLFADRHPDLAHRLGASGLQDLLGHDSEVFGTDLNGDFHGSETSLIHVAQGPRFLIHYPFDCT